MGVFLYLQFISISVYYTSLFVEDVNSWLMVSTETTKIEPPRNILIPQYISDVLAYPQMRPRNMQKSNCDSLGSIDIYKEVHDCYPRTPELRHHKHMDVSHSVDCSPYGCFLVLPINLIL